MANKTQTLQDLMEQELSKTPEAQTAQMAYAVAKDLVAAMLHGNVNVPASKVVSLFSDVCKGVQSKMLEDARALTKEATGAQTD